MATTSADALVADYLERLREELGGVPRARRSEIVQEVSEHIAAARSELAAEDEAAIRTLLDRMGDPAEIAAEPVEAGLDRRGRRTLDAARLDAAGHRRFVDHLGQVMERDVSAVE